MTDPKYRSLFETLKKDILSGKYKYKFPSMRALIRKHGVSKTTVQHTIDELVHHGLVACKQGRGTFVTCARSSRLIGLVVPGIAYSSEFFQPIVAELVRLAKSRDYAIVMDGVWSPQAADNGLMAIEVATRLIKRRIEGVIYQPLEYSENSEKINRRVLTAFSRANIPVVLLDGDVVPGPARSDYDLVSIDNETAGEELAIHMMERGARNIRFLMRANWVENVKNRARGVRNEVLARRCRWSPKSIVTMNPLDALAVGKMMKSAFRPDAVICENDVIAAGLMNTLASLGYKVPDDVLIAGFDDVQIARLSTPGITTIHQPCDEIAGAAFDRLLARMSDRSMMPVHVVLPHRLVLRGSSSKLAKSKGQTKNKERKEYDCENH